MANPAFNTAQNQATVGPELSCRKVGFVRENQQGVKTRPEKQERWPGLGEIMGHLRQACSPSMPVVVRAGMLPSGVMGCCRREKTQYMILLDKSLGTSQAIDTLLHEWAHVLAWHFRLDRLMEKPGLTAEELDRACHDEAWGVAYSQVWRAYLEVVHSDATHI